MTNTFKDRSYWYTSIIILYLILPIYFEPILITTITKKTIQGISHKVKIIIILATDFIIESTHVKNSNGDK